MDDNKDNEAKPKKRSLTEVTLGWIAERFRKAESIKHAIQNGQYDIDTEKIAKSIVNKQ